MTSVQDATTKQDVSNYGEAGDTSAGTMLALTWQATNKVEVRRVARPQLLEPRDVILRVTGTTVCGSDLHLLHGGVAEMQAGDILGHEFCGVADAVGSGAAAAGVRQGQRYVASFQIGCGTCFFCRQQLSSQCERTNASQSEQALFGGQTAGIFGYSHLTGGFAGGQAEFVRVPFGDVNLLPLPDDVPDEQGLFLSDVLCTAYHAVADTPVYAGDEVAVFGAGPIGQMAGEFARRAGAAKVVFVDTEPRLSFVQSRWGRATGPPDPAAPASKAGQAGQGGGKSGKSGIKSGKTAAAKEGAAEPLLELVDFRKEGSGLVARLKALCRDGRGPDVALDCAGGEYAKGWLHWLARQVGAETDTSEMLNEMIEGVRSYGRVGVTGVYVGHTNHFNIGSLMQRGVRLVGNGQAPVHKYWADLLAAIRAGELDPLAMVSHRARLADMEQVYHAFDAKADAMQKVFVETRFSFPRAGGPELTEW